MVPRQTLMIPLDPTGTKPIYLQIVDYVTALARHGQLKAGSRLPPSRSLALQLQVHRSTVVNAYEELKARGILATRQGSGSYIADGVLDLSPAPRAAAITTSAHPEELVTEIWRLSRAEGMVSLALGLPADDLTPIEEFDLVRQRVLRRDAMLHALHTYFPPEVSYTQPMGGFYVWVSLPASMAVELFFHQGLEHGLLVAPAAVFYPDKPLRNAFRLAFSRYPEDVLVRAICTLAGALRVRPAHAH
jgi:DNA-binding transcriptional MocR family regulator